MWFEKASVLTESSLRSVSTCWAGSLAAWHSVVEDCSSQLHNLGQVSSFKWEGWSRSPSGAAGRACPLLGVRATVLLAAAVWFLASWGFAQGFSHVNKLRAPAGAHCTLSSWIMEEHVRIALTALELSNIYLHLPNYKTKSVLETETLVWRLLPFPHTREQLSN